MRLKLQRQPTNDTNMTSPRYRNVHTQINITTISPSAFKMITIQREYTWKEVKEDIEQNQSYQFQTRYSLNNILDLIFCDLEKPSNTNLLTTRPWSTDCYQILHTNQLIIWWMV